MSINSELITTDGGNLGLTLKVNLTTNVTLSDISNKTLPEKLIIMSATAGLSINLPLIVTTIGSKNTNSVLVNYSIKIINNSNQIVNINNNAGILINTSPINSYTLFTAISSPNTWTWQSNVVSGSGIPFDTEYINSNTGSITLANPNLDGTFITNTNTAVSNNNIVQSPITYLATTALTSFDNPLNSISIDNIAGDIYVNGSYGGLTGTSIYNLGGGLATTLPIYSSSHSYVAAYNNAGIYQNACVTSSTSGNSCFLFYTKTINSRFYTSGQLANGNNVTFRNISGIVVGTFTFTLPRTSYITCQFNSNGGLIYPIFFEATSSTGTILVSNVEIDSAGNIYVEIFTNVSFNVRDSSGLIVTNSLGPNSIFKFNNTGIFQFMSYSTTGISLAPLQLYCPSLNQSNNSFYTIEQYSGTGSIRGSQPGYVVQFTLSSSNPVSFAIVKRSSSNLLPIWAASIDGRTNSSFFSYTSTWLSILTRNINGNNYVFVILTSDLSITAFNATNGNSRSKNINGTRDLYITCYDDNGNAIWISSIYTSGGSTINSRCSIGPNGIIISGVTNGTNPIVFSNSDNSVTIPNLNISGVRGFIAVYNFDGFVISRSGYSMPTSGTNQRGLSMDSDYGTLNNRSLVLFRNLTLSQNIYNSNDQIIGTGPNFSTSAFYMDYNEIKYSNNVNMNLPIPANSIVKTIKVVSNTPVNSYFTINISNLRNNGVQVGLIGLTNGSIIKVMFDGLNWNILYLGLAVLM